MKTFILMSLFFIGSSAFASESWVCLCYANPQMTDEVGGISLDPSLSLDQAVQEALSTCKEFEVRTVAAMCTKFEDGEN